MHFTFDIETDDEGQAYVTISGDGVPLTIHGPMPPAATGPFIVEAKLMHNDMLDRMIREILEGVQHARNRTGT